MESRDMWLVSRRLETWFFMSRSQLILNTSVSCLGCVWNFHVSLWLGCIMCTNIQLVVNNRFDNLFDNWLYCVYSRLSNRLYNPVWLPVERTVAVRSTRLSKRLSNRFDNRLTTGWLFVYTIQPVDNRLYRVNGVSVSCLILSQSNPKCLGSSDAENDYQLVYVVCTVRMFKCSAMASNCGGCRRTDAIYHCGWDVANNRCCAFNECSGPSWLSAGDICTNPALFSVRLVVTDCVHESNCSVNMHVYVIFQVFYVRYRHIPVFQVNLIRQLPCWFTSFPTSWHHGYWHSKANTKGVIKYTVRSHSVD